MDYRFFEPILDPVFVIGPNGEILYLNPMAMRWLTLPNEIGIIGSNITKYVTFQDSKALNSSATLTEMSNSSYHLTNFNLPARNYNSVAQVCLCRLPNVNGAPVFSIIVRDRAFINTLMDEEGLKLTTAADITMSLFKPKVPTGMETQGGPEKIVLNDSSIVQMMSTDKGVPFECTVNLLFVEISKAVIGKSTAISNDWLEILINPLPNLTDGTKVNVEAAGNVKLRGFSTVGLLHKQSLHKEEHRIRIKFGTLSSLAKRAIEEYLEVEAAKKR
jgi:hypothetical protein